MLSSFLLYILAANKVKIWTKNKEVREEWKAAASR